jgi:Ni,Fe-hydrogenase I large subunit
MNIQDEMQKIHHKFGVSEMANYKIEQFIENLIKEDRAKQLNLTDVSQRSELLEAYTKQIKEDNEFTEEITFQDINKCIASNCG